MAELKAVKKRSAVDDVYDQMLNMIRSNQWVDGMQIPSENELAKMLDVSRFTVRTAIARFSALHMMETRNGEGTYITLSAAASGNGSLSDAINVSGVIELLQLRRGIEMAASRLAAENRTDEQLGEMNEILQELENAQAENDKEKYVECHVRFHLLLAKMSNNYPIILIMDMLKDSLYDHFSETLRMYSIHTADIHPALAKAIAARDGVKAEKLINENMLHTIQLTIDKEQGRFPLKSIDD